MKNLILISIASGLLTGALVARADDIRSEYQVGIFSGNDIGADGNYTNNTYCGSGPGYTCDGSAGFNHFRVYFVKTDEGVWSFVTETQSGDVAVRKFDQSPVPFKSEKTNLLDSLKPGDKVAFRITKDHRIGAGQSMHVLVPNAEDPKKEDKFVGTLCRRANRKHRPNPLMLQKPYATRV